MSETVLASFNGTTTGLTPYSIVQYGSTLYGVCLYGGANSNGCIFSVPVGGGTPNVLYSFSSTGTIDGSYPCVLVINSTGTILYGVCNYGGANTTDGTIFSIPVAGGSLSWVTSFAVGTSGSSPNSLILSGSTLYGTTTLGGVTSGSGTIFSIPITGGSINVLYTYPASYGNPLSIAISGTTLYVAAQFGGVSGSGINKGNIISIPAGGGSITTIYTSTTGTGNPQSLQSLIISGSTIYCLALGGGTNGVTTGIIFSVSTGGTIGFNYSLPTGSYPVQPTNLLLSGSTIYGFSQGGGASSRGYIFSIGTNGSNFSILYSFIGQPSDGKSPSCLILSSGSTFYGVTIQGGTTNSGTVFSYGPKQYNFLPAGSTVTDRYNISTNGTCQIGDNSNNLLTGTLASPPGKTNTYTLAVRGNINCVGTSADVSGASTGTYYSNSVTSFRIAADSSANRPPQSTAGYIRYNTDLSQNNIEYYNAFNSLWQQCATTTFLQNSFSKLPTITQLTTSSTSPYTPPSGALYLKIRMVGGGGGGAGSGVAGDTPTLSAGGVGGNTTFGSGPLFTATGGSGGTLSNVNGSFTVGGSGTINASYLIYGTDLSGGGGGGAPEYLNNGSIQGGGAGGSSAFGGNGGAGGGTNAPVFGGNGTAGGGGGGGGAYGPLTEVTGAGGGAGGYVEVYFPSPTGTYIFVVGAGGAGGTGNNTLLNTGAPRGGNGGAGGDGLILIEEFYH
jgi:uncharacterized repeat protein (TIGR03803 family)